MSKNITLTNKDAAPISDDMWKALLDIETLIVSQVADDSFRRLQSSLMNLNTFWNTNWWLVIRDVVEDNILMEQQ